VVDIANDLFRIMAGHFDGVTVTGFFCGREITIVDFFVGAVFGEISVREPTLMPVWINSYNNLRPYFKLL